jgi:hypothetical protein
MSEVLTILRGLLAGQAAVTIALAAWCLVRYARRPLNRHIAAMALSYVWLMVLCVAVFWVCCDCVVATTWWGECGLMGAIGVGQYGLLNLMFVQRPLVKPRRR